MGNAQSQSQSGERPDRSRGREADAQTSPVEVPSTHNNARNSYARGNGATHNHETTSPHEDLDYDPPSNLNFPPRLPLRIQEEVYTPGSPIITPDDFANALNDDMDEGIAHQTSILSRTTLDEDEDIDLLDPVGKGMTVPTILEWRQPGEKVFITGTFAGWSRKYRMHRK